MEVIELIVLMMDEGWNLHVFVIFDFEFITTHPA